MRGDRAQEEPPRGLADLPPERLAGRVLSGDQRTARWVGPMFVVFAGVLVVWIVILAVTLPERGILHNEDLVWVGFDLGLLAGLTWTAWAAVRRSPALPLAAAATGACLITDAWFDVVGSDGQDRMAAIAMAVLVELPLAALCWWLAFHSQELAQRRVSRMILSWRLAQSGEGDEPDPSGETGGPDEPDEPDERDEPGDEPGEHGQGERPREGTH